MLEKLILTYDEVPLGSRVNIILPGDEDIETIQGKPTTFIALNGGLPVKKRFFRIKEIGDYPSAYQGQNESVKFIPTRVFSKEQAPVGGIYAVFCRGKREVMDFDRGIETNIDVYKYSENDFVFYNGFPFKTLPQGYDLELRKYYFQSNKYLIDEIHKYEKEINLIKDRNAVELFKKEIEQYDIEVLVLVETLSSRYRNTPHDLVKTLRETGDFTSRYLTQVSLSQDSLLVRINFMQSIEFHGFG